MGEGFNTLCKAGRFPFDVRLNVEKEPVPLKTLRLRTFFHSFRETSVPDSYYKYIRGEIELSDLFRLHPYQAKIADTRCLQIELGQGRYSEDTLRRKIATVVRGQDDWVLVGGPPCQAYSVVGRVKNRSLAGYDPSSDKRFELYRSFLKIVAWYRPSVFVMENVPGLLSSSVRQVSIFQTMLTDLKGPAAALKPDGINVRRNSDYRLFSVSNPNLDFLPGMEDAVSPSDFVVKAEEFGVPQARHRVIILGVREDIEELPDQLEYSQRRIGAGEVLEGLPQVRSGLSTEDSKQAWLSSLRQVKLQYWWIDVPTAVRKEMEETVAELGIPPCDKGELRFLPRSSKCNYRPEWYEDGCLKGTLNHQARSHRIDDLWRYLFISCFAKIERRPFHIRDFPAGLRPRHRNIENALQKGHFSDRFNIVPRNNPSKTVVSHIQKDGHYYIHYDPAQCRSLTVREAARLQTFPDNFFFEGNRTEQFGQVGNAVPPLLSKQIAECIADLLERHRGNKSGPIEP